MLTLKELAKGLVEILLSYHQSQIAIMINKKKYPLEKLEAMRDNAPKVDAIVAQPLDQLKETLQTIVTQTTLCYTDRLSLLNYYKDIIETVLPPLYSGKPLSKEEESRVKDVMVAAIINSNKLLTTSYTIDIFHNGGMVELLGCLRGMLSGAYQGDSKTMAGQAIAEHFIDNRLKLACDCENPESVTRYISNLLQSHQEPLLLKQKIATLEETVEQLSTENKQLVQKIEDVGSETDKYKKQAAELKAENEAKDNSIRKLQERVKHLEADKEKQSHQSDKTPSSLPETKELEKNSESRKEVAHADPTKTPPVVTWPSAFSGLGLISNGAVPGYQQSFWGRRIGAVPLVTTSTEETIDQVLSSISLSPRGNESVD
ncbi:hypothetical protein [Legionella spiritensis]|uniref:hypothetical protein n=1 Tax=Legionella spiritensis TaxID=452 RepID=UPI000F6ED43B|nr:hypothetical protein [Legionella spiritensis]VEG90527.1 Uncharacterised protein [Legionella spiritensis]